MSDEQQQTSETPGANLGDVIAETATEAVAVDSAPASQATSSGPTTATRPVAEPTAPKNGYWWGTGRRKSSVARVRVKPGEGRFVINKKNGVEDHFKAPEHRNDMYAPLQVTSTEGRMDVFVNVQGGGLTGQAGAIRLGLARALKAYDPTLEDALREHGFLTRDARQVERKKYGQPGARRQFQFSKR